MNSHKNDGLRLKLLRIKAGIKALDLAVALGWSPSKLSLIENGYIKADKETMTKIEQAIAAQIKRSGGR